MPTVSTSTRNEPRATSTGTASTAFVRLSLHKTRTIWQRPSRMWNGNSTRPTTRPLSKARTSATPRSGTQSATASIPDLLSSRKTCPEETIYQLGTLDEHASAEDLLNIVTEFIEEFKAKVRRTCSCAGLGIASGRKHTPHPRASCVRLREQVRRGGSPAGKGAGSVGL